MLKINDLGFKYPSTEQLFNRLNLKLAPGNIYGLLGKNGAGKTTLLKIICGLLFPKAGSCHVINYESKKRQPKFLENIYFIPEEFYVPPITAELYINLYAPFYPKFDFVAHEQYLKNFDLPQNKKLSTLSYGQKKKFILAFGVATNCSLLILDEPTNGLDIPSKSQFRKLLTSALTDDKTFIISTHQVHDVENLIDPIIILDDGKIILNKSIHEISQHLSMIQQSDKPDPTQALYYEKNIHGYSIITTNKTDLESEFNLELLFNAIINNKDQIKKIFSEV